MLGMGQHRELCRGFKHCCAGFAASSVVWLQMKAGLGFRLLELLWICSLANYQSFCESVCPPPVSPVGTCRCGLYTTGYVLKRATLYLAMKPWHQQGVMFLMDRG